METMGNKQIYTIAQLTDNIKEILEDNFSFIWITGEISNIYIPASGHYYFNLKDESAQIKAVIFRGQVRNLKFDLENGMAVIGLGRISVYPPRGTYQVILEYIEPAGAGALHIAFEQLKKRLEKEGLFDENNKVPLPPMPGTIGVVTSLSGAVIHDMINVLFRRFENLRLLIAPTKVQGVEAEREIADAIALLNQHGEAEIIIIARGGGSLEDLQAFNSETVARAIYTSDIPVVSAIGHEVDYTIADFTADLRAPTPSAAAELIVPEKSKISDAVEQLMHRLKTAMNRIIIDHRQHLDVMTKSIKSPRQHIDDLRFKTDQLMHLLTTRTIHRLERERNRNTLIKNRIYNVNPVRYVDKYKEDIKGLYNNILNIIKIYITSKRYHLNDLDGTLNALNPMAILQRGYSITRTIDNGTQQVIKNADSVDTGQPLEILLARGTLRVNVQEKKRG
jgi:exodeoxyribonuclease VII large subunit